MTIYFFKVYYTLEGQKQTDTIISTDEEKINNYFKDMRDFRKCDYDDISSKVMKRNPGENICIMREGNICII